ncbi:hypothetical protein DM02DRAFT_227365 [Periconia macrospinosa]|uniref:Uncharacterized protein n=1 Tax=Periconia macrospinosa TaxID=97972 RepID=A0A2V1D774_9PLEO|nr:hypothetical protein DM02DRAFT_227365 [Periconia macrospinosa]
MVEPLPSNEERILQIANGIALQYGKTTHWSTWHFWDFYRRQFPGGGVADPPPVSEQIWRATAPFGSCVDIALQTTAALRKDLLQAPDLQHYEQRVRTLARAGSSNHQEELTHCITALLADTFCVLIDFSCNHKAMMIPLDSCVESLPYHNMHGDTFRDRLIYEDIDGVPTVFRLHQNATDPTRFEEFDKSSLIRKINIRLANEMETLRSGHKVPKTKSVKFQTSLPEPPNLIPWAKFDEDILATTCRVKVDFENQKVLMQVPYQDWLLRDENRSLLRKARASRGFFHKVNDAACNLTLFLDRPKHSSTVKKQIDILARIGEKHGLDPLELHRWIDSIYEIRAAINASSPPD